MSASGWSILCAVKRPSGRDHSVFSIVCGADGGIFIPIFQEEGKEAAGMTMPKWEVNSIWANIRSDVDIDDLIFNYEAYHTNDDDACSDR